MMTTIASGLLALVMATAVPDASLVTLDQTPADLAVDLSVASSPLDRRARLTVRGVSLPQALAALGRSSNVDLAFSPSMLPDETVTCECEDVLVSQALDRLLDGTSFTYRDRDDQVMVVQRPEPETRSAGWLTTSTQPAAVQVTHRRASTPRSSASFSIVQTGTIIGEVRNRETDEPIAGAQVSVVGTTRGAVTNSEGRYVIPGVPAGTHAVSAQLIGYNTAEEEDVTVEPDERVVVNFALETRALQLQQVTVTATTDPIEGVRRPFTVSRVGSEQLQVPVSGTALSGLAGKVAGARVLRGSGQPGSGVNMILRTPTAAQTTNSPLLVVDGVVIGRSMDQSTMDFETMDIESFEVIKGAAAASLYGSRASAGVISITTDRGADSPLDQLQITSRTEYGRSFLSGRRIPQAKHHHFLMNEEGNAAVDADGEEVSWANRIPSSTRIADQPFPGSTFDNLSQLYRSGPTFRQNLRITQRMESTRYLISLTRLTEVGALEGHDGLKRNNVRFSLDQQMGDRLDLSFTGRHMRSHRNNLSGSPNISVLRFPVNVDLMQRDADGQFRRRPTSDVSTDNPLWRQHSRDNWQRRARTSASAQGRLQAFDWLSLDAQFSYDRADINYQVYVPKGTPTGATNTSDGRLDREHLFSDAYDGQFGATLRRQFGKWDTRLGVRSTFELMQRQRFGGRGDNLLAHGVRSLDAARDFVLFDGSTTGSIGLRDERALGYFADLAINYGNKFTTNLRARRDGSSLFGEEERWHTYYGAAAAYRLSEEPWFDLPGVNEFKLRYALGEAGGRPGYSWQWERWQVDPVEGISRFATSGNSQLRPHFTREQEIGLDLIALNNRLSVELVYAWHRSKDQMITVPTTVIAGYSSARANAGVMEGRTYEATIEAFPVRSRNLTWSLNVVMDNSKNYLAEWDRSCFWGSNATGREHEYACSGERMGNWWMQTHAKSHDHLPSWLEARADEFEVNDDGYLVWVGIDEDTDQPNSHVDGADKELWGESFSAGGFTYYWGEPFLRRDGEGLPERVLKGNSEPDLNFGLGSSVRYKDFSVFAQFRGQLGGQVYNRTKHFMYALGLHGDIDQSAKSPELRKPIDYYERGLAAEDDCTGRSCSLYIEHFLENGTYLKLAEMSVAYRLRHDVLERWFGTAAPQRVTFRVNAQNLLTLTRGFTGYDPERGRPLSRIDSPGYPHLRSLTGMVEITF